jgi:hypothetical protein
MTPCFMVVTPFAITTASLFVPVPWFTVVVWAACTLVGERI